MNGSTSDTISDIHYEIRERWYDAKGLLHEAWIGTATAPEQACAILLECPLAAHRLWVTPFDPRGEPLAAGVSGEEFLAAGRRSGAPLNPFYAPFKWRNNHGIDNVA